MNHSFDEDVPGMQDTTTHNSHNMLIAVASSNHSIVDDDDDHPHHHFLTHVGSFEEGGRTPLRPSHLNSTSFASPSSRDLLFSPGRLAAAFLSPMGAAAAGLEDVDTAAYVAAPPPPRDEELRLDDYMRSMHSDDDDDDDKAANAGNEEDHHHHTHHHNNAGYYSSPMMMAHVHEEEGPSPEPPSFSGSPDVLARGIMDRPGSAALFPSPFQPVTTRGGTTSHPPQQKLRFPSSATRQSWGNSITIGQGPGVQEQFSAVNEMMQKRSIYHHHFDSAWRNSYSQHRPARSPITSSSGYPHHFPYETPVHPGGSRSRTTLSSGGSTSSRSTQHHPQHPYLHRPSYPTPAPHSRPSPPKPSPIVAARLNDENVENKTPSTKSTKAAPSSDSKNLVCSCNKSGCLKLYCVCFKEQVYCTIGGCKCKDCRNTPMHEKERQDTIKSIKSKNAKAFPKDRQVVVCKCEKTRCLKLYCDCFKAGLFCDSDKCKCKNCVNFSGSQGLIDHLRQQKDILRAATVMELSHRAWTNQSSGMTTGMRQPPADQIPMSTQQKSTRLSADSRFSSVPSHFPSAPSAHPQSLPPTTPGGMGFLNTVGVGVSCKKKRSSPPRITPQTVVRPGATTITSKKPKITSEESIVS